MDMYWSIDRCGWAPCEGRHDVVATPWSVRDDEPDDQPEVDVVPDLPRPREAAPARVEA